MLVYRIEHPETGEGPYGPTPPSIVDTHLEEHYYRIDDEHSDTTKHPGLHLMYKYEQGFPSIHDFFCGFENREQVWEWFGREFLELLVDCGFDLKVYEAPHPILWDGKQVAFLKDKASLKNSGWDLIGIS